MRRFHLHSILLPLLAALVALVPLPAAYVESLYSARVYPALQPPLTRTSNLLPFAALDPLIALGAGWIVWCAVRRWRAPGRRLRAVLLLVRDVVVSAAAVYLVFAVFWGLNYQRRSAADRFDVDPSLVTRARLERLARVALSRVNASYDPARDEEALALDVVATELQRPFGRALERIGQTWHPVPGRPKASLVAHLFPLAAVDGMINPLALEVLVSPGVLPFERPFLLAHEWAHLAGHARESEASFVAWLACLEGDRAQQYSGWLGAALHLARSLPDGRELLAEQLEDGPRRDVEAIRRRLARAQPVVHRTAWRVYDRYLRTQGVDSGVANYDEVTVLILGSSIAGASIGDGGRGRGSGRDRPPAVDGGPRHR